MHNNIIHKNKPFFKNHVFDDTFEHLTDFFKCLV